MPVKKIVSKHPKTIPVVRDKTMHGLLFDLLKMATPHGTEQNIYQFLPKDRLIDEKGNVIIEVGKDHKTMFSSHLDTVHKRPEYVHLDMTEDGYVYGHMGIGQEKQDSILGADDKLGVWIMCRMIEEKIPGLYVFHVGEERGGIGSRYIAQNTPNLVKNINRCVAFDRMDTTHVIWRQRGGRCCSDNFAKELSSQLNKTMPQFNLFEPNGGGTFTDSASYMKLIPECTNISVGYYDQHTRGEHFDYLWLEQMFLPSVLEVDWEKLPTERDPAKEVTYHYPKGGSYQYSKKPVTIDWDKVTYQTSFTDLPTWSKEIVLEATTPAWKLAILLRKYAWDRAGSSAFTDIADSIVDLARKERVFRSSAEKLEEEKIALKQEVDDLKAELQAVNKADIVELRSENESLREYIHTVEAHLSDLCDVVWDQDDDDDEGYILDDVQEEILTAAQ